MYQKCPRCDAPIVKGVYPVGQTTMTVEGRLYHYFCGWKEKQRLKEEEHLHGRKPHDYDDFGSARK